MTQDEFNAAVAVILDRLSRGPHSSEYFLVYEEIRNLLLATQKPAT